MAIPAGTTQVTGNGDADTVDFSLSYAYSWNYQIVANADGSFSVTDLHGGTITNCKMIGIADLKFADKTVVLVSPTNPTTTAPTGPAPPASPAAPVANGTVTFGAGITTMAIPNGTTEVIGNGGTDTIDFSTSYGYSWNYQIIANTGGTYSISDLHGGTVTNTLLVGIADLKFADQTIALVAPPSHIVSFGAGVTTMGIPNGTVEVIGNGAVDTVDFSLTGAYSWNFTITANAGGTYSVTDVHGGSITNTLMVGITDLKFTDSTIALATGAPITPITAPATPLAPSTPAVAGPTILFAAGVDKLAVPSGTGAVVGNGDAHDVATFANQHDWYTIAADATGVVITDVHTNSITGTQVSGVADLVFSDGWTYDVSVGQYTVVTATDAPQGVLLQAPVFAPLPGPAAITSIMLENPTGAAIAARTVTFGEVFVDGALPAGDQLLATVTGQAVAVQVDAKTFYADGSIDTAELTLTAPALAANAASQVILSRAAAATPVAAINPAGFVAAGYDTEIALTFHNANGGTTLTTINAGQVLTQALAAGTATTWLSGPLAAQVQVNAPINASLHIELNITRNADGSFSTDVQTLNDGIFSTAAITYTYDVAITSHGQTEFAQSGIAQAPMQAWHQVVYSNALGAGVAPADFIAYNVADLEKTGAIPNYDTTSGVTSNTVLSQAINLAGTNTGVLGSAQVTPYEPTTGGRPDIGPTTAWAADWLMTQNPGAEQLMLANANAAGAEPFHAANGNGSLATATSDPTLWLDSRATGSWSGVNNFAAIEAATGWTLDPAHMPDLSYLPALTQGSQYYITQVQDQANYDILSINPGYRNDASGVFIDVAQVRGSAWTIRDLTEAAYVTPAADPLKAYFTGILANNIGAIISEYVSGAAGAQEGQLYGYIVGAGGGGTTPEVAPWEQAYLAIEISNAATLGFAGAAAVAAWENHFITGLFLNGANGYNPLEGTAAWLTVGTASASAVNGYLPYTTWQQVYQANFGATVPTVLDGYPTDPTGGYPAIMKAALASLWDVTQSPDDLAAYAYLTQQTPSLITSTGGYASAQTFDITPTLLDGHHLQNSEVIYAAGGTTSATSANALLAATSGNNVLIAGTGDSILIGGVGQDRLNGGAGDDFLFAGSGAQSLYGGGGTNYLRAGGGVDTFIFHVADVAHDTVAGFKAGTDLLEVVTGGIAITAASLIQTATADAAGDAVLHLSATHSVTLLGVGTAHLSAAWLLLA